MSENPPTTRAFPWIYLAPYAQLQKPLDLGNGIRVVPAEGIAGDPLESEAIAVLEMYERPAGLPHSAVGAFVCAPVLGPELDDATFERISSALAFSVLDANPIPEGGCYSENAGHAAWTTENALLRGHRVDGDGTFVWAHRGVRAATNVTAQLGQATDVVPLAPGIRVPILGRSPDPMTASAAWTLLKRGDTAARRVARAIEWLGVAWENAEIGVDVRLQALHAGFDALFGSDDEISKAHLIRDAHCNLLDRVGEPRYPGMLLFRHLPNREVDISERGYWFHHFTQLRNDIAHGAAIPPAAYRFNGYPHFNRAEYELRRAILATIAREVNQPHLAIPDPFERLLAVAGTAAMAMLEADETDPGLRERS